MKTERFGNVLAYEKRIKVADKYEKHRDDKGIMHYTIPDTDIDIAEGDAVCADMPVERHANTEGIDPDYKIKAITAGRFLFLELEKL